MNQLIADLALESIVKHAASEAWVFTDQELENFAESVVAVCIRKANENGHSAEYLRLIFEKQP